MARVRHGDAIPIRPHRLPRLDTLGLEVAGHTSNLLGGGDPKPGLYVLVGGRQRPSALTATGLPTKPAPQGGTASAEGGKPPTARAPGAPMVFLVFAAALWLALLRRGPRTA